jgi:hypothetical protein
MVLGPTEAFTPEQLAEVYDTNVLSTQRGQPCCIAAPACPGRRAVGLGMSPGTAPAACDGSLSCMAAVD